MSDETIKDGAPSDLVTAVVNGRYRSGAARRLHPG